MKLNKSYSKDRPPPFVIPILFKRKAKRRIFKMHVGEKVFLNPVYWTYPSEYLQHAQVPTWYSGKRGVIEKKVYRNRVYCYSVLFEGDEFPYDVPTDDVLPYKILVSVTWKSDFYRSMYFEKQEPTLLLNLKIE